MADKGARFDTGLVRELAAILREADLGEIEVQEGETRIRVSKPERHVASWTPQPTALQQAAPPPSAPTPTFAAAAEPAPRADHPGMVKSPMVGTVYLQAEEKAPPFVKVGDAVNEGQTLVLVEAMKTFNPVVAPRAGIVKQILVANEQPVEYGEPLVVVE